MKQITVIKTNKALTDTHSQGFIHNNLSNTTGNKTVSMFLSAIKPGEHIPPHTHAKGCETLVYILSGKVKHLYGKALANSVENEAGDFISIPDEFPHQPINLSDSEAVWAIIACNYDQNDPAIFIPYDPTLDQ